MHEQTRSVLKRVGLLGPARAVWGLHPKVAARRAFQAWLAAAGRRDDERMALIMAAVLATDSNCVDVGAAGGDVLEELRKCAPRGRHIAYEPLPEQFEQLRGRFGEVECRNVAVSNVNGTSEFVEVLNGPAWSGLREYGIATETPPRLRTREVTTVRLDDDLPAGYVPSLIKIDVNGAEGLLFEGALATIRRHKPFLLFEHGHAAAAYGTTSDDVYRLVAEEAGMRIFDLDGDGPLDRARFARAAETKWNFFARP